MGFKIMNLGQLWDILIKLVDSVEEFGWRVELVVINFCVILKTQGCKEISEKEGAGSEEQRSCLRDDTKERTSKEHTGAAFSASSVAVIAAGGSSVCRAGRKIFRGLIESFGKTIQ